MTEGAFHYSNVSLFACLSADLTPPSQDVKERERDAAKRYEERGAKAAERRGPLFHSISLELTS